MFNKPFCCLISYALICAFMCRESHSQEGCDQRSLYFPPSIDCSQFEHGDWELIFEDDFNGSHINSEIWYTCEEGWNRKHGDELQYYKDENIIVEDGILHLEARDDPGMYPVWVFEEDYAHEENMFFQYSSAWIQTKAKYQYGYFEVKCKLPEGRGFWPAFWLFGNGYEVDIFEFDGADPHKCHFDAHKWYDTCSIRCSDDAYDESFFDTYHIYSLEWDEFKLVYRIDGVVKRTLNRYNDYLGRVIDNCHNLIFSHRAFDLVLFPRKPMSIILNLAISSNGPNSETVFPSSVDIDYVRVYKRKSPNRTISFNHNYDTSLNYYIGGNITIGSDNSVVVIDSSQYITFMASNDIEMEAEVDVRCGSEVEFQINAGTQTATSPMSKIMYSSTGLTLSNEAFDLEFEKDNIVDEITISPNPSSGQFVIDLGPRWRCYKRISIFDTYGRAIVSTDVGDERRYSYKLNLPKGTYTVIMESPCGIIDKRIEIQ